ncbi:MAG: DCC1-like thiol-disulfide oxidoreductase family protein, partial [Saprospiraceae bacterium]|nr:DCC1-like thiol-disulfide oxidoreductase family protein [Saprospiraceae bacterium]
EVLRYAPLEGETAKEKMGDEYDEIIKRDTVVYYDGDTFYFETKALIKALWAIEGYDWLGWLIWIVPYFIRDAIYRIIANNRKKIFDTCPMIPKEQRHLFLD